MFDKQYLVTVIQKSNVVQLLARGSLNDSFILAEGLRKGPFRRRREIEGSVIEITNSEINLYTSDRNKYNITTDRNLDEDVYVLQIFEESGKKYRIRCKYFDSKDEFEAAVGGSLNSKQKYIANKISYRGISRIIDGNMEERVALADYEYDKETATVAFQTALEKKKRQPFVKIVCVAILCTRGCGFPLFRIYWLYGKNYETIYSSTELKSELDKYINDIKSKNNIIINKIGYREATRINRAGAETKVLPMEHTYVADKYFVEFQDKPQITSL